MPNKPNVAVFDTAFHQTMPKKAFLYGVPYEYYTNLKVRRYGFHGTSHRFIAGETPKFLGKKPEDCKFIICHLGNGSSLSAIVGGKVVDTSMGLTPLEGVLMGTRSGDVDPAVLEYIMDNTGMDQVRFLMSANLGEELKPINKIASGGELARIMLAMKNVLSEQDHVATMVFDEVDTGVSGRAAQKVAEKVNQQEKVKLPTWLNVTLIAEFAVVLVILILRLTAFKDSAVMTHLSSLTLGITCGTLFYIRKYKHTKKTSAMYSIITILLVVMCLLYTTFGILGLLGFLG